MLFSFCFQQLHSQRFHASFFIDQPGIAVAMFSTVLPFTAKKLSKPLGNAFCMHTSRHFTSTPVLHDGRACTNIFRISSKLQIMNLNLPPSFPRYAAALGLPHVQLTQMCQFSSAVERNKNSVSRSQVTKPHPVRTQNEPLSGKELSMDNDANDDHVENGSKPETDHGTSQPKIMNRYMEAKEKMQEKIEQVKDMVSMLNFLCQLKIFCALLLGRIVKNNTFISGVGTRLLGHTGMCHPNGLLFHQKSLDIGPVFVKKSLEEGPISQKFVKSTIFELEKPLKMGNNFQKFQKKKSNQPFF